MTRAPLRLLLVLILLAPLGPPGARADDLSAAVTGVQKVVVQRTSGNPEWHSSFVGAVLATDDAIQTGDASRAELAYQDGTFIRLAENTTLTLRRQENRLLQLLGGKLWLRARKGSKQKIQTPSVLATVVGTEVLIEVDENQTTHITVIEGTLELLGGSLNDRVTLPGGNSSTTPVNQPVSQPAPVDVGRVLRREKALVDPDFGRAFRGQGPPERRQERASPSPVAERPTPAPGRTPGAGRERREEAKELRMRSVPAQLNLERVVQPGVRRNQEERSRRARVPVIVK